MLSLCKLTCGHGAEPAVMQPGSASSASRTYADQSVLSLECINAVSLEPICQTLQAGCADSQPNSRSEVTTTFDEVAPFDCVFQHSW